MKHMDMAHAAAKIRQDDLDRITDVVLAYSPKPKTKPARKRKRLAAKIAKNASLASRSSQ